MNVFSDLGTDPELQKLGRLLDTLGLANGEVMGATKWAEVESVMADTGEKVGTKAGKVSVPDDAPKATDETLTSQETAVDPKELDGVTPTEVPGMKEGNGEGRSLELKR